MDADRLDSHATHVRIRGLSADTQDGQGGLSRRMRQRYECSPARRNWTIHQMGEFLSGCAVGYPNSVPHLRPILHRSFIARSIGSRVATSLWIHHYRSPLDSTRGYAASPIAARGVDDLRASRGIQVLKA